MRLVLDLRHVNPHLWKQKCKFEGVNCLLQYLKKDAHLISFDLKAGYHHVDIFQQHQEFLGFCIPKENGEDQQYYVFTVLPFGLSTAGAVFTRLMNCVVRKMRLDGLQSIVYLDDGM